MNRKWRQKFLYLLADVVAACVVWLTFGYLKGELILPSGAWETQQVYNGLVMGGFWAILYAIAGLYTKPFRRSRAQELTQLFKFTLLGILTFFFIVVMDEPTEKVPYSTFRANMTRYFLLQFSITAFLRMLITTRTNMLIRNRTWGFPTLLIGCQKEALSIYSRLESMRKSLGYRFQGYICLSTAEDDQMDAHLPRLGTLEMLPELVRTHQIEEIIIALEKHESDRLSEVIRQCEQSPAYIKIVPGIYDYIVGSVKITHILGAPLIEIFPQIISYWEQVAKRTFDIVVSLLMLLLLSPLYLLIALAVKLDSPGAVIFRQERIGKGGIPFRMYKFRSMVNDAEKRGPALSSEEDPRITRVGKWLRKTRLDELPQFWNVLKGDMSIVGPRPERQYFIDQIVQVAPHYRHLQKIRPGITSWGQVKFGYASTVPEMVERLDFDILYMENMSLLLDLKILLYTLIVIVEGRGK